MASITEPARQPTVAALEAPPAKPPPISEVGAIAWVRANLFRTTFDSLLTVVASIVAISVIVSLFTWAIGAANWFVITRNLRLLMTGTFPAEAMWRLEWAVLLLGFVVGFTVYAYTRARWTLGVMIAIGLALLLVVPPLTRALTTPALSLLAAGETAIVSGTVTETPVELLGFIGRAGETVTVQIAARYGDDDQALGGGVGFTDRATNALINAARNRLTSQARKAELERLLASDSLTPNQRADRLQELSRLQDLPNVVETYRLNQDAVQVTILDGSTQTPIAEATLTTERSNDQLPSLRVTLPADGWYLLRKQVLGDGVALLETTNIYPLLEQNLTSIGATARNIVFLRLTDDLETSAPRPRVDGRSVPAMFLTDHQYQGMRGVSDYMRLYVAPFFDSLARALLPLALFGMVGFGAAYVVARAAPPRVILRPSDHLRAPRAVLAYLWVIYLIALFVLVYGVQALSPMGLGLLLGRFVWVGAMYFAGASVRSVWGRPALSAVVIVGIIQLVIGEGVTLEQITSISIRPGAAFGVIIWLIIGLYAARMGARRAVTNDARVTRGLVGSALLWLALVALPPVLIGLAVDQGWLASAAANDLLPVTDTRRWGGFLLTVLLTVVAILASFPIGVGLALGRRSSLPVVKVTCILYIELVRGVPLITVLFMAQLLVPLVNPALAEVDNVFRAMVGLTLFSAAYLAENVRGGLQAIPHGQEEAARALGLNSGQVTLLVTLPQALRMVIPALVGQCIALFKDTSLVALVGLLDITGASRSVIAQPEYVGLQSEVYLFISLLYFIFSYLMAYVARRLEASGSGAARRL